MSNGIQHFLQLLLVQLAALMKQLAAADLLQSTAQLRLKDHRQGDHNHRHALFQQPADNMQVQPTADKREAYQHHETLAQCCGTGVFQHQEQTVKKIGNDDNIYNIQKCDCRKQALQLYHHNCIAPIYQTLSTKR